MNYTFRLAARLVITGLLLGLAGDLLLRIGPWGLNGALWTIALVTSSVILTRGHPSALSAGTWRWLGAAAVASVFFLWRDSEALKGLTFLMVCLLCALAACQARGFPVWLGGVLAQVFRVIRVATGAAAGYIPLFLGGIAAPTERATGWGRNTRKLLVGVALALPGVVIFGALFASADEVYARMLRRWVNLDLSQIVSHLALIAVCGWISGGYLRELLSPESKPRADLVMPRSWGLGPLETGIVLGALNLLFASFVLVQLRYLFGGAHLVEVTPGLTYAQYARQGFFQLVAVVALALPFLLVMDWLSSGHKRGFRVQAGLLLLLIGCVAASAVHRLRLYQAEYGWTQQRFYAAAFLFWLVVVLLWFAATVLRDHRDRFAFGALAMGLVLVGGLHVLNPDDWIVRQNLEQASRGRAFDAEYATRLSADATPALVGALPTLSAQAQALVRKRLERSRVLQQDDWRLWSWSRHQAKGALRMAGIVLREVAETQPARQP